jgi:Na+-driven multidrug efflux pump
MPIMAVFYSFLISCFPGMLLRYLLDDFEMVISASIRTGIIIIIVVVFVVVVVVVVYFRGTAEIQVFENKFLKALINFKGIS